MVLVIIFSEADFTWWSFEFFFETGVTWWSSDILSPTEAWSLDVFLWLKSLGGSWYFFFWCWRQLAVLWFFSEAGVSWWSFNVLLQLKSPGDLLYYFYLRLEVGDIWWYIWWSLTYLLRLESPGCSMNFMFWGWCPCPLMALSIIFLRPESHDSTLNFFFWSWSHLVVLWFIILVGVMWCYSKSDQISNQM